MMDGYRFGADRNDVARVVLSKSTWSVLALTCLIEMFTQVHSTHRPGPRPLAPVADPCFFNEDQSC
jgi:hypothetical protein